MKIPPIDRIMRRIDASDQDACWLWPGAKMPKGYGLIQMGRGAGNAYVHRVTYEALHGPIGAGLQLDHLCRNPPCCNPAHLEPVTPRENLIRGASPAAAAARRNECINGHEYTDENTYVYRGTRQCRICRSAHRSASASRKAR